MSGSAAITSTGTKRVHAPGGNERFARFISDLAPAVAAMCGLETQQVLQPTGEPVISHFSAYLTEQLRLDVAARGESINKWTTVDHVTVPPRVPQSFIDTCKEHHVNQDPVWLRALVAGSKAIADYEEHQAQKQLAAELRRDTLNIGEPMLSFTSTSPPRYATDGVTGKRHADEMEVDSGVEDVHMDKRRKVEEEMKQMDNTEDIEEDEEGTDDDEEEEEAACGLSGFTGLWVDVSKPGEPIVEPKFSRQSKGINPVRRGRFKAPKGMQYYPSYHLSDYNWRKTVCVPVWEGEDRTVPQVYNLFDFVVNNVCGGHADHRKWEIYDLATVYDYIYTVFAPSAVVQESFKARDIVYNNLCVCAIVNACVTMTNEFFDYVKSLYGDSDADNYEIPDAKQIEREVSFYFEKDNKPLKKIE